MFFHASAAPGLQVLLPRPSNHGIPLVYLSERRENTLVYLSNAVEKYCRQAGFSHQGSYYTWASYGFTEDGVLRLEEYFPNAVKDTYEGVCGYIYEVENPDKTTPMPDIPFCAVTQKPVPVTGCKYIPDAYEAILSAVSAGNMLLKKYEDYSEPQHRKIEEVIVREYRSADEHPDYRAFLEAKFPFLRQRPLRP